MTAIFAAEILSGRGDFCMSHLNAYQAKKLEV